MARPPGYYEPLHAVIGVWHDPATGKTFYVQRSATMALHPGRWSLFSMRFDPDAVADPTTIEQVAPLFWTMSREQLGGVPLTVSRYLRTDTCYTAPFTWKQALYLFEVRLLIPPRLNPAYYLAGDWMTPAEYTQRTQGLAYGLGVQPWVDYGTQRRSADHATVSSVGGAG